MPNGIPQSFMYGSRGRLADGAGIRNRSGEQFNTTSGNPNLPIFNQAAPPQSGNPGSLGAMPVSGNTNMYSTSPPQSVAPPRSGIPPVGGVMPVNPPPTGVAQPPVMPTYNPQPAGPINPGSQASMGIPYHLGQGAIDPTTGRRQSPYMPYFRNRQAPPPTVANPTNS